MSTRQITLGQVTATFVPFGLLLVAALIGAEIALDLPFQRMIYSIWATMALMIPALCLYILPSRTQTSKNLWLLFWTFAYLAYLVHFYYAVMVHYHASVTEVFAQQGVKIAGSNFLVTFWWALDVVLAWTVQSDVKWITIERLLANIYIPFTFFVASVVLFKGFVNVLGYTMTAGIILCLLVRIHAWWLAAHPAAQTEASGG